VRPANPAAEDRDKVFALKVLRKTEVIKLKQIDHVRHERSILCDVAGHPFITNLLASFSDYDSLYILLDYVPGGELFSYLRKFRRFDEPSARFYAAEIVLVLEYLHEQQGGVAYRDLKPENLLLDEEGHIKLVDFGFAKRLGTVETYTLCGTPEYLAPEVIHNKGHTTAVDWWALGILIYEFLTGYPPFWHQNPIEIYKQFVTPLEGDPQRCQRLMSVLLGSWKSPSCFQRSRQYPQKRRTSSASSAPSIDRGDWATSAAARPESKSIPSFKTSTGTTFTTGEVEGPSFRR
jgi:serine/threonine protein kinase